MHEIHTVLIVKSNPNTVSWSNFLTPYDVHTKHQPLSSSSSSSSSSLAQFQNTPSFSKTMEEGQEPKAINRHGSKEKIKAKHGYNNNIRSSEAVMKLASLAISFNVRLRSSDMPAHMQEHALRYTRSLFTHDPSNKPASHTQLARALKKEFDSVYGPAWHCVIGTSFGSFVSHTGGGFLYFSIDSLSVLLFKTEVHLVTPPAPP